ncbi:hypothetical protein REPUB_Repub13aG0082000 [Reevesia pubescens]
MEHLCLLSKIKLASWCKCKWPSMAQSFDDVLKAPNLITLNHAMKKKIITANWVALPSGVLKFNVDGSTYGKLGPARIGGVSRDEIGAVKLVFFKVSWYSRF